MHDIAYSSASPDGMSPAIADDDKPPIWDRDGIDKFGCDGGLGITLWQPPTTEILSDNETDYDSSEDETLRPVKRCRMNTQLPSPRATPPYEKESSWRDQTTIHSPLRHPLTIRERKILSKMAPRRPRTRSVETMPAQSIEIHHRGRLVRYNKLGGEYDLLTPEEFLRHHDFEGPRYTPDGVREHYPEVDEDYLATLRGIHASRMWQHPYLEDLRSAGIMPYWTGEDGIGRKKRKRGSLI